MAALPFVFQKDTRLIAFDGIKWRNPYRIARLSHSKAGTKLLFAHASGLREPLTIVIKPMDGQSITLELAEQLTATIRLFWLGNEPLTKQNFILNIGSSASLTLDLAFLGNSSTPSALTLAANVAENGNLSINQLLLLQGKTQYDSLIHLQGKAATFQQSTLCVAGKNDNILVKQSVKHNSPATISEIENSLVALNKGKIAFEVNGIIGKGNAKSKCNQHNRGVILSEGSIIQADPKLYIDEFDVEAGHGAAIGQIDEDELFYLESRGLSEQDAKRLIVTGYLHPFLDGLNHPTYQAYFAKQIDARFEGDER